jgi:hypothetical protein
MLTVPSSTVKKLVVEVLRTTTHIGTTRILERPEVLSRIFDHAPKHVTAFVKVPQAHLPDKVYFAAEVELNDRVRTIMAEVERRKPNRLVIDALSEVRMLAKDPLRYRRQVARPWAAEPLLY